MLSFTKKDAKPKRDPIQEKVDELHSFRAVGEKFNFMEIEMIVIGHRGYYSALGVPPSLEAAYRDNDGVLREHSFNIWELPALRAENCE